MKKYGTNLVNKKGTKSGVFDSPDYKPEPYEKDYVMPRTLAQRKQEILRLLKENYELRQQLEALGKKTAG